MGEVGHTVPVAGSAEDLQVVDGCARLGDLEGEIGALLIDYGVPGVDEVLVVQVGDGLVADELNRHYVPLARLEVIGAFTVAQGEPGAAVVHCGLQVEMIPSNMKHGVVVPGGTGNEADVPGVIEAELKSNDGVLEVGLLVKETLVLACDFIAAQNAVLHLPFLLEPPLFADLSLGEMISEMQVFGRGEKKELHYLINLQIYCCVFFRSKKVF